jgi:hypothetical protein
VFFFFAAHHGMFPRGGAARLSLPEDVRLSALTCARLAALYEVE